MTVLPGLIDWHNHLAFHGYELASRWELNEPGSTRHLRTARVIERTLAMATRRSVMPAGSTPASARRSTKASSPVRSPTSGSSRRPTPSGSWSRKARSRSVARLPCHDPGARAGGPPPPRERARESEDGAERAGEVELRGA